MRISSKSHSVLAQNLRLGVFLLLLAVGATASAQTVMPGAQSGTMQAVAQDDGSITISGVNYIFDNGITKVFYAGQAIDSAILQPGMVLRFTVNRDGIVDRIEILGPAAMLSDLNQH